MDQIGAPEAAALRALESAFFIGAELCAIVLLAATAVVTLRAAVLPRWWAAVSIVLAVWLPIGPIGWVGSLGGLRSGRWSQASRSCARAPSRVRRDPFGGRKG